MLVPSTLQCEYRSTQKSQTNQAIRRCHLLFWEIGTVVSIKKIKMFIVCSFVVYFLLESQWKNRDMTINNGPPIWRFLSVLQHLHICGWRMHQETIQDLGENSECYNATVSTIIKLFLFIIYCPFTIHYNYKIALKLLVPLLSSKNTYPHQTVLL